MLWANQITKLFNNKSVTPVTYFCQCSFKPYLVTIHDFLVRGALLTSCGQLFYWYKIGIIDCSARSDMAGGSNSVSNVFMNHVFDTTTVIRS